MSSKKFEAVIAAIIKLTESKQLLSVLTPVLSNLKINDLADLISSLEITAVYLETSLLAYNNFPKSIEEYSRFETTKQENLKSLIANKVIYENSHHDITQIMETINELADNPVLFAALDAVKDTLQNIAKQLLEYSHAADELLEAMLLDEGKKHADPETKSNPATGDFKYDRKTARWNPSSGVNFVCGFASYVLPLHQAMLSDPAVFYKDGIVPQSAQRFFATYLAELGNISLERLRQETERFAGNPMALQNAGYAIALKRAFARTVLNDESEDSPFRRILTFVVDGYLNRDAEEGDDADYAKDFFERNVTILDNAHKNYVLEVASEIDNDHRPVGDAMLETKANRKLARNKDGNYFLKYLEANEKDFLKAARQNFYDGITRANDMYMARDLDVMYIGRIIGFRSVTIDNNWGRSGFTTYDTNPDGKVDMVLRHRANHWEGAPLVLPAKPEAKPATPPVAPGAANGPTLMQKLYQQEQARRQERRDAEYARKMKEKLESEQAAMREEKARAEAEELKKKATTPPAAPGAANPTLMQKLHQIAQEQERRDAEYARKREEKLKSEEAEMREKKARAEAEELKKKEAKASETSKPSERETQAAKEERARQAMAHKKKLRG